MSLTIDRINETIATLDSHLRKLSATAVYSFITQNNLENGDPCRKLTIDIFYSGNPALMLFDVSDLETRLAQVDEVGYSGLYHTATYQVGDCLFCVDMRGYDYKETENEKPQQGIALYVFRDVRQKRDIPVETILRNLKHGDVTVDDYHQEVYSVFFSVNGNGPESCRVKYISCTKI